ncbi:MAG: AAA family ATPase [Bacillota bacterium]
MRISDAKKVVKDMLVNLPNMVICLEGESGIGKSDILRQAAEELEIGYFPLYSQALEGPDFMGLVEKDLEKGVTRYLAPDFLPTENAVREGLFPEEGLLVLEEWNRADTQTIHVLFPLLQDRRVNRHYIAPGWRMAVAMNPDTSAYTTNVIDVAGLDRVVKLTVETHIEDYTNYNLSLGTGNYDRDVLEYLNVHPEMLIAKDVDGSGKTPRPRAWSRVQLLRLRSPLCAKETPLSLELVAGCVGPAAAGGFWGYLRDRTVKPIPAAEVLAGKNFASIEERVKQLLDKGRLDVLTLTVRELVHMITPNHKKLSVVEDFIMLLPREVVVMFCKLLHVQQPAASLKYLHGWPKLREIAKYAIQEVVCDAS